jgi:ribosomal protein S18 acetylase RimI-like enzyme
VSEAVIRAGTVGAVTLAVEVDNPAARLYLRHGFQHDVEINRYYRMRAELGSIMRSGKQVM